MKRFESFATAVLVLAAVTIAVAAAKRAFFEDNARVPRAGSVPTASPLDGADWNALRDLGRPISDTSGTISIVVFDDFECPACRAFHRTLRSLEAEYPKSLSLRIVYFPLDYHRFARPSARLAECTDNAEVYSRLVDAFFASQDSLGLISWEELAARAGHEKAAEAAICATLPDSSERFARIARGIELGRKLGIAATPTVVLNGNVYSSPPGADELKKILAEASQR